jgi:hypothetical protein
LQQRANSGRSPPVTHLTSGLARRQRRDGRESIFFALFHVSVEISREPETSFDPGPSDVVGMLVLAHTLGSAFNVGISSRGVAARAAVSMSTLMDFSANKIDGSKVDFKSFAGKPTLILNVASL